MRRPLPTAPRPAKPGRCTPVLTEPYRCQPVDFRNLVTSALVQPAVCGIEWLVTGRTVMIFRLMTIFVR